MNDFYDDGDLLDNNHNNQHQMNDVKIDDSHAPNNNPQNLEFHDFQQDEHHDFYNETNNNSNTYTPPSNNMSTSQPNSFNHDDKIFTEEEKHEQTQTTSNNSSFYEAEYYQPYFNVDTKEVLTRTLLSLWPVTSKFFEHIKDNPDLWGPFWISTSLIFLMTVSSNLANYFTALIQHNSNNWAPDLQKLPWATIAIYGYVGLLPLIYWIVFRCKKIPISLIQFYCTYGYSLFIYLPISVITLIAVGKLSWLSWILIMAACLLSTAFLVVNFIFIIKPHSNALLTLIIPMAACSVGLALLFKLYLFKFPVSAVTLAPTSAPNTTMAGF